MCERLDEEEVIGGDLSGLEVTKGGYYLCRKDFFESMIPDCFFGDKIHILSDSRRWRTCNSIYSKINAFRNTERDKIVAEFRVSFNSESRIDKIEKAVSSFVGVESVTTKKETGRLYVSGRFDPQAVVTCVRDFEKMVQVTDFKFVYDHAQTFGSADCLFFRRRFIKKPLPVVCLVQTCPNLFINLQSSSHQTSPPFTPPTPYRRPPLLWRLPSCIPTTSATAPPLLPPDHLCYGASPPASRPPLLRHLRLPLRQITATWPPSVLPRS